MVLRHSLLLNPGPYSILIKNLHFFASNRLLISVNVALKMQRGLILKQTSFGEQGP